MSYVPPENREPRFEAGVHASEGTAAAVVSWSLFILSIPSAWVLVIVGLVLAYATRGSATGLARRHLDAQIALFWSVFWWSAVAFAGIFISLPLMLVGIGFITIVIFGLGLLVISIWFTIKSIIGVLNLLADREP